MYRIISYTLLFIVSALLQIFLFDNLSISIYIAPLVYVAFIALLPMESSQLVMLICGVTMGLMMDWTMGLEGINMAVTLFSAYSRRFLLGVACGRESAREGGIPTVWRMGNYSFMIYLLMFVGLHHLLFFLLEGLSWGLLPFVLIRFVLSSLITICFTWLLSHLFVSKI